MLGSRILETALAAGFELEAPDHRELDITRAGQVQSYFETHLFDVLINCAAFTRVDDCEESSLEKEALLVNGEAVGRLAQWCGHTGRLLIHFSTDYVFDGQKSDSYIESDQTHSINAYGETKLEGEKRIQEENPFFYLIRASWLYGPGGRGNFVKTIVELLKTKTKIDVVNDQFGGPTYTGDLAEFTLELLGRKAPAGIYHFANEGYASWYDFAKEIQALTGLQGCEIKPTASKDFPRKAARPANSRFDLSKSAQAVGHSFRPWREALQHYLSKELV
jgi:dTDP-4-dehydrorhamnose reductase